VKLQIEKKAGFVPGMSDEGMSPMEREAVEQAAARDEER
jgi:hypothetical protein